MPILRSPVQLGFALILAMTAITSASAAPPPLIALFSDYGWQDSYVAQLKGVIATDAPNARFTDLTHAVTPFNVDEGAYLLDQCAAEFPKGTIFLAVVDPQVGTERAPIILETKAGKFYVGPDNGLFTLVVDRERFSRAWTLDKPEYFRPGTTSHTFHGRDIFAPIAARLATGTDPDKLGSPLKTLSLLPIKQPTFSNGTISVEVLHTDRYGNVILNFPKDHELSAKLKEGNLIKVQIGKQNFSGPLVKTYGDIDKGRLILLYGGNGLLEIAKNQGSAAKELKVEPGTVIFLKP